MISEDADPSLGDGQPDDRTSVHRWARSQLWQGRRAVWRYRWAQRQARRAVLNARKQQQRERIEQRQSATSVEDLAKGARVNATALRRGGVTTAADVDRRSVDDLEKLQGIGRASALKIKEIASRVAHLGADDLRPPANPDKWNPGDLALVRSLAMLALITAAGPHAAVLQQALGTVQRLARATNFLVWLFSPPTRRARVEAEAPKMRSDWLAEATQSLQGLLEGLDQAKQAAVEPDSSVTDEWRANSPRLLALLEQILARRGSAEERAILQRGLATRLSSGLLDRIQSTVLNTARLALHLRVYQEFGAKFAVAVRTRSARG